MDDVSSSARARPGRWRPRCWRAPAPACASSIARRFPATSCAATRSTRARSPCFDVSVSPRSSLAAGAIEGMLVTGQSGDGCVAVEGRYPRGLAGRSVSRRDLDWALLQEAIAAGARFEPGVAVREAVFSDQRNGRVVVGRDDRRERPRASVRRQRRDCGRRPAIARWHSVWACRAIPRGRAGGRSAPTSCRRATGRRWARCTSGGDGTSASRRFPAVSSTSASFSRPAPATPIFEIPRRPFDACWPPTRCFAIGLPALASRVRRSCSARLAVDATGRSCDGLLLAGDAAGFIDPMTGDGLRFAIRGGELAALAALRALEHGWSGVHLALAAARRREFAAKWRFNRALRSLVGSPVAVRAAAQGARIAPGILHAMVRYAGDCGLAEAAAPVEEPADEAREESCSAAHARRV